MNLIWKFFFGMFLFLGPNLTSQSQDINLSVIANGSGIPAEMNFNQLKSAMKGEKQRWPDGSKVIIALMKSTTQIGVSTSKKVYNMSADALNKYWLALVFQGKADAPNFFNSESELEEFIAQTKGAIGIVNQVRPNSKQIIVDGKKFL